MNVLYWSKNTRDERFTYQELDELLMESDVIFYALAKNPETENILDIVRLSKIRNTAIFISITHTNHSVFIKLVEEGKIG